MLHIRLTKMLTINLKPKKLSFNPKVVSLNAAKFLVSKVTCESQNPIHLQELKIISNTIVFAKPETTFMSSKKHRSHDVRLDSLFVTSSEILCHSEIQMLAKSQAEFNNVHHTWVPPPHSGRLPVAGILKRPKS